MYLVEPSYPRLMFFCICNPCIFMVAVGTVDSYYTFQSPGISRLKRCD